MKWERSKNLEVRSTRNQGDIDSGVNRGSIPLVLTNNIYTFYGSLHSNEMKKIVKGE
jgi:hypothetical protein